MLADLLAAAETGTGGSPNTAVVAAWSAGAAFLGVLLAQLLTGRREKTARRAESQRAALYDLQRAAHALRQALAAYGADSSSPKKTKQLDDATGKLAMLKQRILCEIVRNRVDEWQMVAQAYYLGDETVTVAKADRAWNQLQDDIGKELRRLD